MPAEHPLPPAHDISQPDPQQTQVKLCFACRCPLSAEAASASPFIHDPTDQAAIDSSPVCASCHSRLAPTLRDGLFAEVERELLRRAASLQPAGNEPQLSQSQPVELPSPLSPPTGDLRSSQDMSMDTHPVLSRAFSSPVEPPTTAPASSSTLTSVSTSTSTLSPRLLHSPIPTSGINRPNLTPIDTSSTSYPLPQAPSAQRLDVASVSYTTASRQRSHGLSSSPPDPLLDITHLRVHSQGHHCLYPGATFQGTQKSGRNSYDVNVTIVDVDFSSSHLCGYLRIRGLTDDWPELTTYFDAEIIGSRYGFLTRNWGATEQEDMVHWARFPAFRHVKSELKKPHLTMQDALNRGAVFMRWKEKFLVPDHRVQDINGASFAGFYYVCVDFNPQQSAVIQLPSPVEENAEIPSTSSATAHTTKPDTPSRSRRISLSRGARKAGRSASRGCPSNVATMSGFYFHQNSEPYQQLSLVHVPEHTSSCFEFR